MTPAAMTMIAAENNNNPNPYEDLIPAAASLSRKTANHSGTLNTMRPTTADNPISRLAGIVTPVKTGHASHAVATIGTSSANLPPELVPTVPEEPTVVPNTVTLWVTVSQVRNMLIVAATKPAMRSQAVAPSCLTAVPKPADGV